MSFFKRIRDKVTPPKVNISLKFKKSNFALGEDAEGTLTVTPEEEFDATEIRYELECVEEAKKIRRVYDERLHREVEQEFDGSANLYSVRPAISGPVHMIKGDAKDFPFSVNIPAAGRPTYKSIDAKVTWTVKGVIAVDGRPDATSEIVEVQVTQPSVTPVVKEKEVIREVIMIPCKYCGALMPQIETVCPTCGARRTA